MDGKAAGILGSLPSFQRVRTVLPIFNGIAEHQYLIRTPKHRAFLDSVFRSAKRQDGTRSFSVRLKPKLWDHVESYVNSYFTQHASPSHELVEISDYITACYAIRSSDGLYDSESDSCSDVP